MIVCTYFVAGFLDGGILRTVVGVGNTVLSLIGPVFFQLLVTMCLGL